MRLLVPPLVRVYCRRCQRSHPFKFTRRMYRWFCGFTLHPLTLMLMYSVDDYATPAVLLLPQHALSLSEPDGS